MNKKHIHILGICGTFMGSLAIIAKQKGFKVTGCDQDDYPPMSNLLKKNNIEVHYLTDWEEVYNEICQMDKFGSDVLTEIRKFLDDPIDWSNNRLPDN